jgi:predicted  nucleic acid-binding Zn-ribbon protein
MEPIGVFLALVLAGMSNEIEKQKDMTAELQSQLNQLGDQVIQLELNTDAQYQQQQETNIKLGSAVAANSARDKVIEENLQENIDNLEQMVESLRNKIDFIDRKIMTLHE